jgi:hypothetical protein
MKPYSVASPGYSHPEYTLFVRLFVISRLTREKEDLNSEACNYLEI